MLANIQNYSQRIHAGKQVEHRILASLRKMGHKIENPTADEDKYDKIDGWWIDKHLKKYPVQVKFRQSGDDILFELIKDIDKKIEGRHMLSKAVLYLVADSSGKTRLLPTSQIKKKASELLNIALKDMDEQPFKTRWSGAGWQMNLQIDRAGGQRKLVAYFDPKLFTVFAVWDINIH